MSAEQAGRGASGLEPRVTSLACLPTVVGVRMDMWMALSVDWRENARPGVCPFLPNSEGLYAGGMLVVTMHVS